MPDGIRYDSRNSLCPRKLDSVFRKLVKCRLLVRTSYLNGKTGKNDRDSVITYQGVNYTGLIPVLLQAIQERQQEIEALTAKIGK